MHYGIEVVTLGDYADPRLVVQLAQAAEAAGWEGVFIWDHLGFTWGAPSGDPWIILAAVAQATRQLKLGTAVMPIPRRRPFVVANAVATLDLLSEGRVIFGVGLGGMPEEFSAFGEPAGARERAGRLDEGLDILSRLWSGQKVNHRGQYYTVNGVTLAPLPRQQPHPPIWIGGESRPAMRRAAHWDGWIIGGVNEQGQITKSPAQLAEQLAYIRQHRSKPEPFAVAMSGYSNPGESSLPREFEAAGLTWWLESLHGFRGDYSELRARVMAGPPAT
jgi:probable F420-dependent oxidoreductase